LELPIAVKHGTAEPLAHTGCEGKICGDADLGHGGKVDDVSETMNVVRFPLRGRLAMSAPAAATSQTLGGGYEFTEGELVALCRWFSAMKYAFPGTEGVMVVSHQHGYSAVGLYHPARGVPNCLVAKHEVGGSARFFWSTEVDQPRAIDDLCEITDAHIRAIQPPRNEEGWLDPAGWMGVYASRTIATELQVV
jgi:hypothetical protein